MKRLSDDVGESKKSTHFDTQNNQVSSSNGADEKWKNYSANAVGSVNEDVNGTPESTDSVIPTLEQFPVNYESIQINFE